MGVVDWTSAKEAFASVFIISLIPNLLLFIIPSNWLLVTNKSSLNYQHILLAFAAGGLLGDVFLHILPHLLGSEHHQCNKNSQHNGAQCDDADSDEFHAIMVGSITLLGFLLFFIAERLATLYFGKGASHSHSTYDDPSVKSSKAKYAAKRGHQITNSNNVSASAWLNLLADSMHNFTDGIALGASYASGKSVALAATLSILFHELPHEVGDFTILLKSGYSKWQAIRAQFVTAIAAFIGTGFGLLAGRNENLEEVLLALTAGGFVYIGTVSIFPSLLVTHSEESSSPSKQTTAVAWLQIVGEACSFALGVGFMVAVALLEAKQ